MSIGPLFTTVAELFQARAEAVAARLIFRLPTIQMSYGAFVSRFPNVDQKLLSRVFAIGRKAVEAGHFVQLLEKNQMIDTSRIPTIESISGFGQNDDRFSVEVEVTLTATGEKQLYKMYTSDISTKGRLEGEIVDFIRTAASYEEGIFEEGGELKAGSVSYEYAIIEKAW